MNPIEQALKKIKSAQQNPQGHSEIWVPKKDFQEVELPEQKFEHLDVHPIMKEFWKTKSSHKK